MNYYFDCELIEDFHKPLFGKRRHFIDLISIGIVAEDGREYYAISNEFNPNDADEWVRENVLYPIMVENGYSKNLSNLHGCLGYDSNAIKRIQGRVGKSNKQIAKEVQDFIYGFNHSESNAYTETALESNMKRHTPIEVHGYYSDYDWVLFCSLFGAMKELPKYFPMYCRDLKQMLDETLEKKIMHYLPACGEQKEITSNSNIPLENKLYWAKTLPEYPKQSNEHDALSDARWNKQLYNFIRSL